MGGSRQGALRNVENPFNNPGPFSPDYMLYSTFCKKVKSCLPLALFSIRYTPTGKTGLSPYEILFGNAPRLGLYFPQSMQLQCDSLTAYVIQLQQRLTKIHKSVYSSLPDPNSITGTHTLLPGDYVYVKKHTRKTLEPRFEGPYQVLLTTATSVKLEGKPTWIHASHCKKQPEKTT